MSGPARPNDAKLKELILYIAEHCADDPYFGATKLNKILFYSDFLAYGYFGQSITAHPYFRLQHGPAPRRLLPIQHEMERDDDIVLTMVQRFAFRQKRIVPLRAAALGLFTRDELGLVQEVIDLLRQHSAVEASELSHTFLGWELVEDQEDIPYETVFLSGEVPDAEHIQEYRVLAERHGWVDPVAA